MRRAFVSGLIEQHYSGETVYFKAACAVDFNTWLARRRITARRIDEGTIARYHDERPSGRQRVRRGELCGLRQLLVLLRERGIVEERLAATPRAPFAAVVARFEAHL